MISLTERAYAKLNFTLDVLAKRPDGYHDLCSVMQSISLCDELTLLLDTGKPWRLLCDDASLAADATNLAWKAAEVYCTQAKRDFNGLEIHLQKRIPMQAGLGGGSADAAAVLRALNRHDGNRFSLEKLCEISAQVGSDVPFCVCGGTMLAEGRGEILTPLPPAPEFHVVVCKPPLAFSTPALFASLDETPILRHPDTQTMCLALQQRDSTTIGTLLCNVFAFAVAQKYPQIAGLKNALLSCGACGAQMTGSGSAVFGLFTDENTAKHACQTLQSRETQVFLAKTV